MSVGKGLARFLFLEAFWLQLEVVLSIYIWSIFECREGSCPVESSGDGGVNGNVWGVSFDNASGSNHGASGIWCQDFLFESPVIDSYHRFIFKCNLKKENCLSDYFIMYLHLKTITSAPNRKS